MEKTELNTPELAEFRKRIDALDDKIIELFIERIGIVAKVGEHKRRTHPGRCPIRPAREAEVVQRVMEKFEGTPMLPAAAGAMWRTLIGASTSTEGALSLSVFAADHSDYYWLAREYFGLFIPTIRQPHVKRVIGDVMDGKASVGIVPMPHGSDTSYWWTNLIGRGDLPKVFAVLPYIYHGAPGRDASTCLAIAKVQPEPSGDDRSLFVIEASHNTSQHKLQSAFAAAKLNASWISIATLSADTRHHLVELKGFFDAQHPAIAQVTAALGEPQVAAHFLGAYAAPIVLKTTRPHAEPAPRQAAKTSQA